MHESIIGLVSFCQRFIAHTLCNLTASDIVNHDKTGRTYDLIFDVIGASSPDHSARALRPNGRYLTANPRARQQLRGLWQLLTRRQQTMSQYTGARKDNLHYLRDLIEAGHVKPIVDRRYPLEQIADAHRYVESGRKKGSVVITIRPE